MVESKIKCGCEMWTVDCRLKKKLLSPERNFWRVAAKTSKILQIRDEELEKNVSQTVLGKMGSSL